MECSIGRTDGVIPAEYLDLRFTIRRHIEQVPMSENLENEYWAQGVFENNGYFDVTAYPIEGEPFTDRSATTRTTLVDGRINFGDSYADRALTMSKSVAFAGWTVDGVDIVLKKSDGSYITDHTVVPEVIDRPAWDPYTCGEIACPVECAVNWDAPGNGVECCVGQSCGGTALCDEGSYIGLITSISYEDHEADHGSPFVINAGLNDAWVTAQAPYQGLFITVYPELGLVFVAWFTFEVPGMEAASSLQSVQQQGLPAVFGGEKQRWVTAVGSYSGNRAELNVELTSGGLFNASEPIPEQDTDYGTMVLEFDDCETGTVSFDIPGAELSGAFPIGRVVDSNVNLCETLQEP